MYKTIKSLLSNLGLVSAFLATSTSIPAFAAQYTVDVMVIYPTEVKDYFEKNSINIEEEIKGYIDYSNQVFNNSNVNIELNLVYQAHSPWLGKLTKNSPTAVHNKSRTHQLRSYYGADIVVALTENYNGKAEHVGKQALNGKFSIEHRISPVAVVGVLPNEFEPETPEKLDRRRKWTFLHETGHLMGLRHDHKTTKDLQHSTYTWALDDSGLLDLYDFKDEIQKKTGNWPTDQEATPAYQAYLKKNNFPLEEEYVAAAVERSTEESGLYRYSMGYSAKSGEQEYGTIMSYADDIIPYFSSPDNHCSNLDGTLQNLKCGSEEENASKSLNQAAPEIANFCSASKREKSELALNFDQVEIVPSQKLNEVKNNVELENIFAQYDFVSGYYSDFEDNEIKGLFGWNKSSKLEIVKQLGKVSDFDDQGNKIEVEEEKSLLKVTDSQYFPAVGLELSCAVEEEQTYRVAANIKTTKATTAVLWLYYELAAIDPETDKPLQKWFKVGEANTDSNSFTILENDIKLPQHITTARLVLTSTTGNTLLIDNLIVAKKK
ncbi:zinc-dependent metalloprotease family protein [Spartinivicinus ruber]|uniref:zinc-dependent metalloprotease family protein n=1 Tax=Spartinivicinus ruber TaxID=2683272 RepID=UPI0013D29CC1|nr:zinc-dependent metalloprotease family protein [Spartinivicinus ruber]